MRNQNCDLLFEYLRSILFDTKIKSLDLSQLEESYQQLGQGMQFLQLIIEEMLSYSEALSKGNLSVPPPRRDNLLCTNLKNLNATLSHLTWQAKQVAAGDYSQHVSYLGEFSDAFNTMTAQLKEREEQLRAETEKVKRRSETLTVYNELMEKLTNIRLEWILVVDAESKEVIYNNREIELTADDGGKMEESSPEYRRGKEKILRWNGENEQVWEIHSFDDRYYQVSSYPINLQERRVFAHTVTDITEQKRRQLTLSNKAYFDPVTSLHNRLFFEEYIDGVMRDHRTVTLAYIDLDGLKFVNDHYGHGEGDRYLQTFAGLVRESFRSDDVFARIGGDEFCVVLEGSVCDLARRKLELIRSRMIDENTKEYPVSFSYGVREIVGSAADQPTLQAILRDVDNEMYQYKRKHKKQRAAV